MSRRLVSCLMAEYERAHAAYELANDELTEASRRRNEAEKTRAATEKAIRPILAGGALIHHGCVYHLDRAGNILETPARYATDLEHDADTGQTTDTGPTALIGPPPVIVPDRTPEPIVSDWKEEPSPPTVDPYAAAFDPEAKAYRPSIVAAVRIVGRDPIEPDPANPGIFGGSPRDEAEAN